MILLLIKRMCILSCMMVFCATSLQGDCPKTTFIRACEDLGRCNKGALRFKELLEKLLFDKIGKFEV